MPSQGFMANSNIIKRAQKKQLDLNYSIEAFKITRSKFSQFRLGTRAGTHGSVIKGTHGEKGPIIVALLDVFFHSGRQAYLEKEDTNSPQQSNSLPLN